MNKLMVLYEMVNVLREKEKLQGKLEVIANRHQQKIFSMETEFTMKNLIDFHAKLQQHSMSCHGYGQYHQEQYNGLKNGLNRVAFLLQTLNNLQMEEQPNQSILLTLSLANFPEDLKQSFSKHWQERQTMVQQAETRFPFDFLIDIKEMTDPQAELCAVINEHKEIEKLLFVFNSAGQDKTLKDQRFEVKLELNMLW